MNTSPDVLDPQCTCGFDHAVSQHIPALLRTARKALRSEDLAWDAVQECLVHAWRNQRVGSDPGAALGRLTLLKSLELRRESSRRQRREEVFARQRDAACSSDGDPSALQELGDRRRLVREAVAQLPAECSEVVSLCHYEGLDYVSAAERIGIPVGTVRSRLHRARRLLRAPLAELQGEDALRRAS